MKPVYTSPFIELDQSFICVVIDAIVLRVSAVAQEGLRAGILSLNPKP